MIKEDLYFYGIKALIINEEGEILLLQINPDSLRERKGEPYRDVPGGRVERGMTEKQTLEREIIEEIGVSEIEIGDYIGTSLSHIRIPYGDIDYGLFLSIYECAIPKDSRIIISSEHSKFQWFSVEEALVKLSIKYSQELLSKVRKKLI